MAFARNGEETALLNQAENAGPIPIDVSELDDLPPHRAAVPVPPIILTEALGKRRHWLIWPSVGAAVLMHCGLLVAAMTWGQGEALPPGEQAIAVELAERIIIAKGASELGLTGHAPSLDASSGQAAAQTGALAPIASDPAGPEAAPDAAGTVTDNVMASAEIEAVDDEEQPEAKARLVPRSPGMALARLRKLRESRVAALHQERRDAASLVPVPLPASRAAMHTAFEPSAEPSSPDRVSAARAAATRASMSLYKRRVRSRIKRNLPYGLVGPGQVAVRLKLSRSGRVESASVLRSSGDSAIDRAALMIVRQAGPYPTPPRSAAPDQLALAINFRFQ